MNDKTNLFILTVGHNGSGKTTLAKSISEKLGISVIEGDDYRRMLRDSIAYFKDLDFSHPNPKARIVSELTIKHRHNVCTALLNLGQPVIQCSVSPTREQRKNIIDMCVDDRSAIKIVFIYVTIDENELLQRLEERDRNEPNNLGWVKHYIEIKKPMFEEPISDECDELIIYDQTNEDQVIDTLKKLL